MGTVAGFAARFGFIALVATAFACDPPPHAKSAGPTASHRLDLPWPLPAPSTSLEIPAELRAPVEPGNHLDRPASWLVTALHEAGYNDLSFYDVPGGFVIVPGLELVDDQGQGMTPPDPALRFSGKLPQTRFFTLRFWSELLAHRKGRYRLVTFVVVDSPVTYSTDVTEGHLLWRPPAPELPLDRVEMAYTFQDRWYALVYEFEKAGDDDASAKLVTTGPTDPAVHLAKSGLLEALKREAGAK